jgi:tRNA threonylcarbamoyladenosine biosynthesis protein TsaB
MILKRISSQITFAKEENEKFTLFLDTSSTLSIGIWKNSRWVKFLNCMENQKSINKDFHVYINQILDELNVEIQNCESVVYIAGPGSYTGLRMSESFSQTLSYLNIKTVSLYHFHIPQLLGVQKGLFIAKAFKGEVFLYEWDLDKKLENQSELSQLIKSADVENYLLEKKLSNNNYFNFWCNQSWDQEFKEKYDWKSTIDYFVKNFESILERILLNPINYPTFYFRPQEVEFRLNE